MDSLSKQIRIWKRWLRYVLVDFFASGLSDTHDVELIRKTNMLNAIGTVGILALTPLGIDAIRLGNISLGLFDLFVATLLAAEMIYLRKGSNYLLVINAGIFAAGSLFFFLMITNWAGGAAYLWYFVFPLLTSFLLGSKKGLFAAIILFVPTILVFMFNDYLNIVFEQSVRFQIRFIAALGVVTLFAYAFEKTRENTQEKVRRKNDQLNKKLVELEELKEILQTANEVLDLRVQERTSKLTEINITLDREVKEKEVMLKEIHHRVKNNLQIISSLLYLQSQNLKDENLKALFKDSRSRILSMAMVHENLYRSDDLANVNIREYIQNLTTELISSYIEQSSAVELQLEIDSVPLTIEKAIPMGLIINELVSNALKYAFNDFKKNAENNSSVEEIRLIKVFLKQKAFPEVQLTVTDNGQGIPENINFEDSPSLGLQLVNSLINQLDGNATLNNNGGAQFDITFSIE